MFGVYREFYNTNRPKHLQLLYVSVQNFLSLAWNDGMIHLCFRKEIEGMEDHVED